MLARLSGSIPAAVTSSGGGPDEVLKGRRPRGAGGDSQAQAFLDGEGAAAIGAILGSAIPLTAALTQPWQYAVLAGATLVLLGPRCGVVLAAGATGLIISLAGGPLTDGG